MLTRLDRKLLVLLVVAALFFPSMTRAAEQSENKSIPGALKEFLAGVAGYSQASSFATLVEVNEPALARLFPDYHFFSLVFRMHPIARMAPPSLEMQNVFIVPKAGRVQHVTAATQLENFFKEKLGSRREEVDQKAAVRAWLALSQTFAQDGMFQFSVSQDSLAVAKIDAGTNATGKAEVTPNGGNRGEIMATLHFTPAGELTSVKEERNVQEGVRPICQATRLLDPDPIVRKMAVQDLLVMGRAATPYLRERRKIASPELVQAIDAISEQIEERESAWDKSRVPVVGP